MKFTFAHNNFNVTDLDKSLKFYEEALDPSSGPDFFPLIAACSFSKTAAVLASFFLCSISDAILTCSEMISTIPVMPAIVVNHTAIIFDFFFFSSSLVSRVQENSFTKDG